MAKKTTPSASRETPISKPAKTTPMRVAKKAKKGPKATKEQKPKRGFDEPPSSEFYPDVKTKSTRFLLHRVHEHRDRFRSDFPVWLAKNESVWKRFEQEANFLWINGRRHYSARTIIEFIRHETAVRQVDGDFKINNSYVPDLARLYSVLHPERPLFECRVMSGQAARRRIRRG